ncbi:hypothetical protein HHK36_019717 [Tetracentron sinense]|uniref:Uncharacterized protein n=1 Tax=Tetracentron sinense TaxID=13715 RepID=A0A834Z1U0_TETSI|nr:hypothetical protein HHK36_019717 [Tetracentron sinense]
MPTSVPSWVKKFCFLVGSITWRKLLETKKTMFLDENVVQWNDSAGEEAFHNAKKRFWADINGLPYDVPLPDPDMYIDEVDWNSEIDPELLIGLDKKPVVLDDEENAGDLLFLFESTSHDSGDLALRSSSPAFQQHHYRLLSLDLQWRRLIIADQSSNITGDLLISLDHLHHLRFRSHLTSDLHRRTYPASTIISLFLAPTVFSGELSSSELQEDLNKSLEDVSLAWARGLICIYCVVYSGFSKPTSVPSWAKKFCFLVGSITWRKLLETKKTMFLDENVIQWTDSAGEEAFHNAKKRSWAEINGLPYDVPLSDPDMYIDEVDWNSEIDPKLLTGLDKKPVVLDDEENVGDLLFLLESTSHGPNLYFYCVYYSGFFMPNVPSWEKKFCIFIGSITWRKLLETHNDNVLPGECDSVACHMMYLSSESISEFQSTSSIQISIEVDWNSEIEPELLMGLDKKPVVPDAEEKDDKVELLGDLLVNLNQPVVCTGWGDTEEDLIRPTEKVKLLRDSLFHLNQPVVCTGWGD